MLPPGLVAQPADRAEHQRLRGSIPTARTVVRLLVGACSCDLVRPRHSDPREDERHHRDALSPGRRDARRAASPRSSGTGAAPTSRRRPAAGPARSRRSSPSTPGTPGETLYLLTFGAESRALPSAEASVPVRRVPARRWWRSRTAGWRKTRR